MNLINIISIAVLVLFALAGYFLGFGKSLKVLTGGIVGIIISAGACFAFGGALMNLTPMANFIDNVNNWASNNFALLEKVLGYIAFYGILFIIIQILRVSIVKAIINITDSDNPVIRFFNKFFGVILCVAFIGCLGLLILAGFEFFSEKAFIQKIIEGIEDSFLYDVYLNNPIHFS